VLGAPRRLHIGGVPPLGSERPQGRRRMKGAGADLQIIGLQDDAALPRPVILQFQKQALEGSLGIRRRGHLGAVPTTEVTALMVHRNISATPRAVKRTGSRACRRLWHPAW